MEDITKKFNELVSSNIKFDNKYIAAAVSLLLAIYAGVYAPKLPEFLLKLLDNVLVKILLMFLVLYINLKAEPAVSLIVAVSIAVLLLAINLLKKDREHMAQITGIPYAGIPAYTHSICGHPRHPCDPANAVKGACRQGECKLGEHGERSEGDGGVGVDGPISGVSDAEMESLCMHLKKDKNATDEILTSSNFSELLNTTQNCQFASHQYQMDFPDVKCAGAAAANGPVFSNLAPVQSQ